MKKGSNTISSVFKGSTTEQIIKKGLTTVFEAFKLLIVTGYPLTLLNSIGRDLVNYKIYGNSVQDGTPTPDTPIEVESVGEKTKNLLSLDDSTVTRVGVTIVSDKKAQTVKVNGTATSSGGRLNYIKQITLEAGTYYFSASSEQPRAALTDINNTSSVVAWTNRQFTLTETTTLGLGFNTILDETYDSTILLQIEKGEVETEYEPYGYKIPVKVSGKNIYNPTLNTQTLNGITVTRNSDNTYTVNGTATATTYIHLGSVSVDSKNTYYLSGGTTDAKLAFQLRQGTTGLGTLINSGGISVHDPKVIYSTTDTINVVISISSGATVNNVVVKPMISVINTDEYEPYVKPKIYNIYLDEPLRKIGENADYIDFGKQKLFRNVEVIDDTGTLMLEESLNGITDDVGTSIELATISTHEGTNIIEIDTSISPSNMEVEYYAKGVA